MDFIDLFEIHTKTGSYLYGEDIEITPEDLDVLEKYEIEWDEANGIELLDRLVGEKLDELMLGLSE